MRPYLRAKADAVVAGRRRERSGGPASEVRSRFRELSMARSMRDGSGPRRVRENGRALTDELARSSGTRLKSGTTQLKS